MPEIARNCQSSKSKTDVSLAFLNADQIDFAFLTAARFFCVAFSENDHSAWVTALLGAESFFPGQEPSETMRRSLAVVQEMRTSRRSVFRYSNPRCQGCSPIVTQDERYLLQMIQYARAGRRSKVTSSAMLLCEGNAINRVVIAAEGFADIVSRCEMHSFSL